VLRADTNHGPVSGRIRWPTETYTGVTAKQLQDAGPVVDGAVGIDRRPGAEIIVDLGHNATNDLLTLFTVRGHRFVQLRIEAFSSDRNTFAVGGSVCCGSTAVDCTGGRPSGRIVVESFWYPARDRTRYEIRFYRLAGITFRRVRSRRGVFSGAHAPPAVPVISGTFGSC